MQPLEALRHPVKIRSDRWREKREAWQKAVESELPAAITDTGSDQFRASELPAVRALRCGERAPRGYNGCGIRPGSLSVHSHHGLVGHLSITTTSP